MSCLCSKGTHRKFMTVKHLLLWKNKKLGFQSKSCAVGDNYCSTFRTLNKNRCLFFRFLTLKLVISWLGSILLFSESFQPQYVLFFVIISHNSAGIYMFKVNNSSKVTIFLTSQQFHTFVLVFLLLTLSR